MNRPFHRLFLPLLALTLCLGLACGSTQQPEPEEPTNDEPDDDGPAEVDDGMAVEGLRGTLRRDEVDPVLIRATQGRWQRCYVDAFADHPYLVGDIDMEFTVGADGSVESIDTRRATLGSRDVYDCIMQHARTLRFPRPHGGSSATFEYPLQMDPEEAHPHVSWSPDYVYEEMQGAQEALGACTNGSSGFRAIVWVGPDGRVRTLHVIAPSESRDDAAQCLERAIREIEFPDPGAGQVARVTVEI